MGMATDPLPTQQSHRRADALRRRPNTATCIHRRLADEVFGIGAEAFGGRGAASYGDELHRRFWRTPFGNAGCDVDRAGLERNHHFKLGSHARYIPHRRL